MHGHFVLRTGLRAFALFLYHVLQAARSLFYTVFLPVGFQKLLAFFLGAFFEFALKFLQIFIDQFVSLLYRHFRLAAVENSLYGIGKTFCVDVIYTHALELLAHSQSPCVA